MIFLPRKKEKNLKKNMTYNCKREESRIEKLDLFGISKNNNGYFLIFEIKKDDLLSTARISIGNLSSYIESIRRSCYPGSSEEQLCIAIIHHLKIISRKGRMDNVFESVQKISKILKTSSVIKELIRKGPMPNNFERTAHEANSLLFKIGRVLSA